MLGDERPISSHQTVSRVVLVRRLPGTEGKKGEDRPTDLQRRTLMYFSLEAKPFGTIPEGVSNTEERSPSYLNVLQRKVSSPRYATFFIVDAAGVQ